MTDPDHDSTDTNPRTRWQRVAKWCALTLATLVVVVALTLIAFSVLMARVPEYRAQMQAWISARAKMDIEFSDLHAEWRGYGPELVFTDAVIRSSDGERLLARADEGGVGFDLWQALRTGRLAAARFSLRGTELKAQRRADGRFEVVGQADWPEFNTDASFKLDSLPVGQVSISDVRLSFRDLKTGRGPWLVDNVALIVKRSERVFDVQGQATLPAALGSNLSFSAHGEGNLNEVAQLRWRAQVSGKELNLAGWKQVVPEDWPKNWIAPTQGQGSFELLSEWQGAQVRRIGGHLNFVDVLMQPPQWSIPLPQADSLQVRDDDPEAASSVAQAGIDATRTEILAAVGAAGLHYSNVELDFTSALSEQGWLTRVDRLQLARDAMPWPVGTASVLIKFGEADGIKYVSQLQAKVQTLVLNNLWPLLAYLPETEANARLRALNVSGRLFNLALQYERDAQQSAPRYGVRVEFAQLGISPVARTPGINGLSGVLLASGARGEVRLDSHDVEFNVPRIFRTPLPLDHVTGRINWTRTAQTIDLRSDDVALDNADGKAQAKFTLRIPHDGSPVIDMQAMGTQLNAAAAPRYMPAGVMHRRTLAWLDAAFPAGTVTEAHATLKGPLRQFPFRGGEGLFLINAQIDGLTLNYQEGWLPATGLKINAEFRNAGLSATATAGDVNGLVLERAEGRIKDYRDSEINITARTQGSLDNAVRFVQQSPVGPAIGSLFQRLTAQGDMQGNASMYFPLKDFAKRRVDIGVSLKDATVSLADVAQQAKSINGSLRILNDGIVAADLRGEFLQNAFAVTTESAGRGRYNVVANGIAQAQPLAQFLKLPAWARLDGNLAYRYTMPGYAQRDAGGTRHLYTVDSDLRGLAIDLPQPVGKPANVVRALRVDADLLGDDMQLRGALGDLRALVRLQPGKDSWRFDRAGLRADSVAAALPAHTGLRVEGRLETFVLDDWLKLGDNDGVANKITPATRVQDVLRGANMNIGKLRIYGFELPEVRGVLQATDEGWRIDAAGAQAAGQVLVPYEFGGARPLTLNMEVLKLTTVAAAEKTKPANGEGLDPRELPSISADIRQFHYGEHSFGHLQLNGARTTQGLQVSKLQIAGPSFNGAGSGSWLQGAGGPQSALALTLESSDVRATMQQFNYADFVAAKRGKLIANLRWPGGVDENLLGRASGTLELQVDEGQLLNVQPGAGRVLGLLSVAALPRRLGLDFRDVTDQGLAFDTIHADFNVQNGDARTENLLLRGPTAEIGIAGRIGLGARDYDQTAVVTGDVGAALPVAGVMAGGPVVGAALLLFTQIFKEPLKGVARAYYHIGGTWDDPQIERIDASEGKASLSGGDSAQ